ncbi:hypothetical protein LTR53_017307, partial [Teratosphaeriaceae sp. CCFEE 6253]
MSRTSCSSRSPSPSPPPSSPSTSSHPLPAAPPPSPSPPPPPVFPRPRIADLNILALPPAWGRLDEQRSTQDVAWWLFTCMRMATPLSGPSGTLSALPLGTPLSGSLPAPSVSGLPSGSTPRLSRSVSGSTSTTTSTLLSRSISSGASASISSASHPTTVLAIQARDHTSPALSYAEVERVLTDCKVDHGRFLLNWYEAERAGHGQRFSALVARLAGGIDDWGGKLEIGEE